MTKQDDIPCIVTQGQQINSYKNPLNNKKFKNLSINLVFLGTVSLPLAKHPYILEAIDFKQQCKVLGEMMHV